MATTTTSPSPGVGSTFFGLFGRRKRASTPQHNSSSTSTRRQQHQFQPSSSASSTPIMRTRHAHIERQELQEKDDECGVSTTTPLTSRRVNGTTSGAAKAPSFFDRVRASLSPTMSRRAAPRGDGAVPGSSHHHHQPAPQAQPPSQLPSYLRAAPHTLPRTDSRDVTALCRALSLDAIPRDEHYPGELAATLRALAEKPPVVARSTPRHALPPLHEYAIHELVANLTTSISSSSSPPPPPNMLHCLYDAEVYDSMMDDSLRACAMLTAHLDDCIGAVRTRSPEPPNPLLFANGSTPSANTTALSSAAARHQQPPQPPPSRQQHGGSAVLSEEGRDSGRDTAVSSELGGIRRPDSAASSSHLSDFRSPPSHTAFHQHPQHGTVSQHFVPPSSLSVISSSSSNASTTVSAAKYQQQQQLQQRHGCVRTDL